MVQFQWCKLFKDTFSEKSKQTPDLLAIFNEFRKVKEQDPTKPFGSRDTSFISAGNLAQRVPKLRHAHLLHDLNLCYTVSDKDPTIIRLYGVFKHDELGTGQPANIKRQKNVATAMANQSFEPLPSTSNQPPVAPPKSNDYKQSSWYKNQNR